MIKSNSHEKHRSRIKKRFLNEGLYTLNDQEVLEMLLYYALPRKDTAPLSKLLLERFITVERVLEAKTEALCAIPGISYHTAVLLKMVPEIADRFSFKLAPKVPVNLREYAAAGEYFVSRYFEIDAEEIHLACLDNAMNVMTCQKIASGDVNTTKVTPRNLTRIAIKNGASFVILAHNHPGGVPLPSTMDLNATREFSAALNTVGIPLVEHFVVAGKKYVGLVNMNSSFDKFFKDNNL